MSFAAFCLCINWHSGGYRQIQADSPFPFPATGGQFVSPASDEYALAPGQITQTYAGASPTCETATGINAGSSLLLQGFTLAFELVFREGN